MNYLYNKSLELGVPEKQLENLWQEAIDSTGSHNPKRIKIEFEDKLTELYTAKAKGIIDMREDYKKASQKFFENLSVDDFINADKQFEIMVESKIALMVNDGKKDYLEALNKDLKKKFFS